jgi:hypothetical protein
MKNNVLPYDGETILIQDNSADFDWAALTRMLIGTIPWQAETAQLFGRELVVPRLTAWFGDAPYSYSGILHRPAPFPEIVERLRERARRCANVPPPASKAGSPHEGVRE